MASLGLAAAASHVLQKKHKAPWIGGSLASATTVIAPLGLHSATAGLDEGGLTPRSLNQRQKHVLHQMLSKPNSIAGPCNSLSPSSSLSTRTHALSLPSSHPSTLSPLRSRLMQVMRSQFVHGSSTSFPTTLYPLRMPSCSTARTVGR